MHIVFINSGYDAMFIYYGNTHQDIMVFVATFIVRFSFVEGLGNGVYQEGKSDGVCLIANIVDRYA